MTGRRACTAAIAAGLLLPAGPVAPAGRCGGRAGAWVAVSGRGAPSVSPQTPAVTIGQRIFVFGPQGAIFDACANSWQRMSKAERPPRAWDAQWRTPLIVGDRLVFLGFGNRGEVPFATDGVTAMVYDVSRGRWSTVPDQPDAFAWRRGALIAPAGREVIVWGGVVEEHPGRGGRARLLDDGARLDPATGRWRAMSRKNAPSARSFAQSVWTGGRLVVWGGIGTQTNPYQCGMGGECKPTGGGGVYDPATDTWAVMAETGAPSARRGAAVRRLGGGVLVWGGVDHPDGALYDPGADRWRALPPPPPSIAGARLDDFTATADGTRLVVVTNRRQAAVFDAATWTWTPVPDAALPAGLKDLRDLGAGSLQLIVARKEVGGLGTGTLARVNAQTARWEIAPLPPLRAPTSLETGIVAWAGERLIVWGPRYQKVRYEKVPGGAKGCGPPRPGEPICDPVVPVREVRIGPGGQEGGLLRPEFVSANAR